MCGYFLNHFGPGGRSQAFERNQLVSHTPVIASVHSVELGQSEIPEQGAEESTPRARIPSKRGWNCGIKNESWLRDSRRLEDSIAERWCPEHSYRRVLGTWIERWGTADVRLPEHDRCSR